MAAARGMASVPPGRLAALAMALLLVQCAAQSSAAHRVGCDNVGDKRSLNRAMRPFGAGADTAIGPDPSARPCSAAMALQLPGRRSLQQAPAMPAPGPLVYWGPSYGQGLVPDGAKRDVVALVGGYRHCVALLRDKSVVTWGDGENFELNVPKLGDVAITAMSGGKFHTIALLANGTAVQWGREDTGVVPAAATEAGSVASVHAGDGSSFAVLRNGTVLGWGEGLGSIAPLLPTLPGQQVRDIITTRETGHVVLFTNDTLHSYLVLPGEPIPSTPTVLQGVAAVSVSVVGVKYGGPHLLALMNDSTITGFGDDALGQVSGPAALTDVAAVAAGRHSLIVLRNGSVRAYGDNTFGQVDVPESLRSGASAVAATAGDTHSAVLLSNGTVIAWGKLPSKQPFLPPALQGDAVQVLGVAVATHHGLVITANAGRVVAFGVDLDGETVVPAAAASGAVAVAAARNHSLVLLQSGRVVSFGALPDDGVPAEAQQGVTAIAAGLNYSAALLANGSVAVWGGEPARSCGVLKPPVFGPAVNVTAISAGERHMLALLSDGSVRGWGCNDEGQASVPPGIGTMAVAVAAGANHSLVLLSTGQTVGFGNSDDKQLKNIDTQTSVIMISAGAAGSFIELSDGQTLFSGRAFDVSELAAPVGMAVRTASIGAEVVMAVLQPLSALPSRAVPAANTASSGSSGLSTAAIGGLSAGVVIAVVAACLAGLLWWRRKRAHASPFTRTSAKPLSQPPHIPGLEFGHVFLHSTARYFDWTQPGLGVGKAGSVYVEAGVNDAVLDTFAHTNTTSSATPGAVVKLTSQQLVQQVKLLPDGLVGTGGIAVCFKCVWPSRFGANALLAAKVLKDGFTPEREQVESFAYEASVLSGISHPNIVRLYGYCLEPPTVCLILELLPYSLKDLLYKPRALLPGDSLQLSSHTSSDSKGVKALKALPRLGPAGLSDRSDALTDADGAGQVRSSADWALGQPQESSSGASIGDGGPTATQPSSPDEAAHLKLSMLQVLQISADVAAGLAHLHAAPMARLEHADGTAPGKAADGDGGPERAAAGRIVHRDLKPANILLSRMGVAKIIDFGLARRHDNTTVVTEYLGVGTLSYMAPELLVGSLAGGIAQHPTKRVDVYSLGMIIWEMLAGRQPWDGMPESTIAAAVIGGKRPQLSVAAPKADVFATPTSGAPPNVHQITADALAKLQLAPPSCVGGTGAVLLSQVPASLDALPELADLVAACWQHRELRRPIAAVVHAVLQALLRRAQDLEALAEQQHE